MRARLSEEQLVANRKARQAKVRESYKSPYKELGISPCKIIRTHKSSNPIDFATTTGIRNQPKYVPYDSLDFF